MAELDFQPDLDFQPEPAIPAGVNPSDIYTRPEVIKQAGNTILGTGAVLGYGAAGGVKHIVDTINNIFKAGAEATDMHPLKGAAIAYHLLTNTPDEINPDEPSNLDKFSKVLERAQTQLAAEEKEQGIPPIPQIAGEVAGGFVPSLIEWGKKVPGTIYAALGEAAAAHAQGESWPTAVKMGAWGGIKRVLLQNVLDRFSKINNAYARRGLSAATLGGAAAAEGGTPQQILTQAIIGGAVAGKTPEEPRGPEDIITRRMVTEPGPMPGPPPRMPTLPEPGAPEVPGAEAARFDFQPEETPTPALPTKPLVPEKPTEVKPAESVKPPEQLPPDLPEPQGPEAARFPVETEFPIQETGPKQEKPPTTPQVETPPAITPEPVPAEAQPTVMRRKTALSVAHDAARVLGMTDEQRAALNTQLTGKASMADMSIDEARKVAMELQKQVEDSGLRVPQVGPNAPNLPDVPATMTVGGATRPAKEILESAVQITNGLHKEGRKEPAVFSAENGVQKEGLVNRAIATQVGENNFSIPALMEKLGGLFKGITRTIGVEDYLDGFRKTNAFAADLYRNLPNTFKQAGISLDDLRQMSRSLDPRYGFIRTGAKVIGQARTVLHPVTLGTGPNGGARKATMSGGEMIDFYLCARQEGGLDHIKQSGIHIWGRTFTGITDADIKGINNFVNNSPKLKAAADILERICSEKNNPALNETSQAMIGEDVADRDHYWGLRIHNPKLAKGQGAVPQSFIDNPRWLKEREGGGNGALVIEDAFDKFTKLSDGVADYVGMAHPIRNIRTLLNYGPFIKACEDKGLVFTREKVITLLDRIKGGNVESTGLQFVQPALRGAYRGVLQFNPRPVLAEGVGEIQEMAHPDFTAKDTANLGAAVRNPAGVQKMLEQSPTAYMRFHRGSSSMELGEAERNESTLVMFTGQHMDINKPNIMMKSFDAGKLYFGWQKAMEMTGKETDLTPDTPEWIDAVDKRACQYWSENCPSWDKWNRSMNSSDPTLARPIFYMFRSYWEKATTGLNRAIAQYSYSDKGTDAKKALGQTLGATMASIMANAAIRSLIGITLWQQKKTVAQFAAEVLSSPAKLVAITGDYLADGMRLFIEITNLKEGEKIVPDFQSGQSLPLELIHMFGKTFVDYSKGSAYYIDGDQEKGKKELKKAAANTIMAVGLAKGVPVYDIQRWYKAWLKPQENSAEASRSH